MAQDSRAWEPSSVMLPRRITLIRAALPVKCPSCGAEIAWKDAGGAQFLCPECGHGVHLRNGYFRVLYLLSALLTSLIAYGAGIRGDTLFWTVCIFLVPTYILLIFITMRLFPPDVESTGDYRGILYGVARVEDIQVSSERPQVSREQKMKPSSASTTDSEPPAPLFEADPEHWTLEGVALLGAAVILVLFAAWMAARPLIYRVLPELGATQVGPAAFPVTVHIGQDTLRFANGSTEHWSCKVGVGVAQLYTFTFAVDAQESREVPYSSFQPIGGEGDELRRLAREKVVIECAEPSGRTHFWIFS
jgi:predicted RNA-binding Zn-ribbon protein involved in translation (DUF1610 family)